MWCVSWQTRLSVPDPRGWGRPPRSTLGADRKEVTVDLDETIEQLSRQLVHANAREAARIRTRIQELKALKQDQVTT